MNDGSFRATSYGAIASVLLLGCGGSSQQDVDARVQSAANRREGDDAFADRNFILAADKYKAAIDLGGLNADGLSDASVKLAVSLGATSNPADAEIILTDLEQRAPNLDQIYAARAYVLAKQGKVAESRAAMAKARQFNRSVQEFKD